MAKTTKPKKLTKKEIEKKNKIGYKKLENKLTALLNEIAKEDWYFN